MSAMPMGLWIGCIFPSVLFTGTLISAKYKIGNIIEVKTLRQTGLTVSAKIVEKKHDSIKHKHGVRQEYYYFRFSFISKSDETNKCMKYETHWKNVSIQTFNQHDIGDEIEFIYCPKKPKISTFAHTIDYDASSFSSVCVVKFLLQILFLNAVGFAIIYMLSSSINLLFGVLLYFSYGTILALCYCLKTQMCYKHIEISEVSPHEFESLQTIETNKMNESIVIARPLVSSYVKVDKGNSSFTIICDEKVGQRSVVLQSPKMPGVNALPFELTFNMEFTHCKPCQPYIGGVFWGSNDITLDNLCGDTHVIDIKHDSFRCYGGGLKGETKKHQRNTEEIVHNKQWKIKLYKVSQNMVKCSLYHDGQEIFENLEPIHDDGLIRCDGFIGFFVCYGTMLKVSNINIDVDVLPRYQEVGVHTFC